MRYLQAYSFVFGSRNWAMNLLLASLCVLIPVVGPIILIGYLFEVIDALLGRRLRPRDRKSAENASDAISVQPRVTPATVSPAHAGDYPDLTFDRLGEYLTRGIWPFLVQFIVNLPVGVVFAMLWMLGVVLMGVATANDWDVAVPIIVVILFLVYLLAIVALGVVSG